MSEAERAQAVLDTLKREQPEADCTLDWEKDWQLLFSGILAAQCTDARVNKVTGPLYKEWPELSFYANCEQEELEEKIRSCGLYRNKAKSIRGSAKMLLEDFDGKVPRTEKELLKLPGVGRKIANLVLGDGFGIPAVVVDTHCGRITRRLGFSEKKNPEGVERDLMAILPEDSWIAWGHHLVFLGRTFCDARCPDCANCPVKALCREGRDA